MDTPKRNSKVSEFEKKVEDSQWSSWISGFSTGIFMSCSTYHFSKENYLMGAIWTVFTLSSAGLYRHGRQKKDRQKLVKEYEEEQQNARQNYK